MAQKERLEQIREMIHIDRRVTVSDLSEKLGVTPETIRRDLKILEQEKLLTRRHGGAELVHLNSLEQVNYLKREQTHVAEKHTIGLLAAELIPKNSCIGCDASSTSQELLEVLRDREDLLIVTNSVKAIFEMERSKFRLLLTGGYINRQSYSLQGGAARHLLREYHLEIVFMSCKGLSLDGGIFDSHDFEIEMKQAMLEQGSRVVLLADHSKFDCVGFSRLANISQIDAVVTDKCPSDEWMKMLKDCGTAVYYPQ
ncbi:MAG: DeoR/GlpR family DNA-binding transcription regulator [Clostridiales bacterium]|nr:DeoR/GlpR family DNA-binding transcription regulator [Clostridiales bacterium]